MTSSDRRLRVLQALVVGLCGVCLVLAASPARAADPRSEWDLLAEDGPAELRGYHADQVLRFTVPPGWENLRDPS